MSNEEKPKKNSLPKDVAEKQVDLFMRFYDIDPVEDAANKRHRESLQASLNRLVKHVMRGRVEITLVDNKIKILQRLEYPINDVKELEYNIVGGIARTQMKNAEEGDEHGKIYSLVGSLTGWTGNSIAKLISVDISVVECLGVFFLIV